MFILLPNFNTPLSSTTGELLKNKEEFIESLSNDNYVIQIPEFKGKRLHELEKILSIFDQSQKASNHILNISENDFPEEYRDIIRKLQRAILEDGIQNTMDIEDEIIAELADKERRIWDLIDSIIQKDTEISQKDAVISQKGTEISQKDKLIEELKRKLSEI